MRIPGRKFLRRGLWRLRGSLFGGGVILGYHRVADDPDDPWDLCAPPDRFEQQMEILRREFRPVSLATLIEESTTRPARHPVPVAVTFDDGYADVLHDALPILERFEVPATTFVVLDGLRTGFWWDRLQRIAQTGDGLPGRLELRVGATELAWSRERGTTMLENDLYEALAGAGATARDRAMAELEAWARQDGAEVAPPPALLSEAQIRQMDAHPLIDIGSHGASHDSLAGLETKALDHEVSESKRGLEALLGRPVECFSYPHGVLDEAARARVERAGYRYACASWNGLVARGTDAFRLPRLWPSRQTGPEFRRWLRGWTGR